MHLVDDLVLRVIQVLQVVVVVSPGPGPGVGIALDKDVLRGCASGTDPVDGSLVQVQNERLVHVVVLVVCVEDDFLVGGELGRDCLPEGLEIRGRRDDTARVSAEVLGINDCVGSAVGDEGDCFVQVGQVGCVWGAGHAIGDKTLHQKGNAEDVHARVAKDLDL